MEDFVEKKTKKNLADKVVFRGYRRLFLLVCGVALLWQVVGLVQWQLRAYHQALTQDFKMVLAVAGAPDNEALNAMGEDLSAREEITSVHLFSPADGLAALQAKNPRLAGALVTLGREQMPAYFEIKLTDKAINTIDAFAAQLAAQYPQLSVKYSAQQARLAFWSGLLLRTVNMAAVLALVLLVAFMFLVEAYPVRGKARVKSGVFSAMLAWALSLGVVVALLYPAGQILDTVQQFTSIERQLGLLVWCALLGWTLGKWQKF